MPFNIKFNILDYKHILPSLTEYEKHDEVINAEDFNKGNIDKCIWTRHEPTNAELSSPEFRQREITRILKTGAWVAIKDTVVWLPPSYYNGLQYGRAGSSDMQFRLKRLMHVYFKLEARLNPGCKGTLTIKNRGDGETTMSITDGFWECADGIMDIGQIGLQSKTRPDAINPCWSYLQTLWQSYPKWLKDALYSDFISGTNIAEKIKFLREEDKEKGLKARNVLYTYYPSGTPMDGKHDMKKCILDEICKWEECSFYHVFTNYSKFIMPGFERRGLFDMFSSPADKDCKSNEEVYELWKDSNTDEINEKTGTTKSRVHRYYSNPLHGIHGAYDKWGDADPEVIYDFIMNARKAMPKDKLLEEVRGYPLNEQEMFESADSAGMWSNQEGINKRKIYLIGARAKGPLVIYGNLDWKDGVKDYMPVFRPADKMEFDVDDARFCFSHLPKDQKPLDNIFQPPSYIENCAGIDSVDKRYAGKRPSNFAMVNHKFRDIEQTGIIRCPTWIYCNRPLPIEIAYEDAIKGAVFTRSMVQVESLNTKVVDHFEDRGYINWMISKIGQPRNSLIKGDAPSGNKSAFMDEIVGLIDAITSLPFNPEDPYWLELNNFLELLEDVSKFNLKDTHARDLSMAWGQSLLGSAKLLFKKTRQPSELNEGVMEFLLG
jgi:hypothetical protein